MKRSFVKFSALVIALVLGLTCLTGCGLRAVNNTNENTVLVFEGEEISVEEAEFYIRIMQYETEVGSSTLIQMLYGDLNKFWASDDGNGYTYANYAIDEAMSRLVQTKTLVKKAAADGITLTAEDNAKVDAAVDTFKETYADVLAKYTFDDAMIKKYISENAIAKKVYMAMVADVDTTMDADAMKRKTFIGLSITGQKSVSADEEAGTEAKEYTEEEAEANRHAAMEDVLARMQAGESISDITTYYASVKEVAVSSFGTLTATPEDVPEKEGEFTSYRQKAWTMSNGEYATIDTQNSGGTTVSYVLYMQNDDDADARAEAEAEELATRKGELFQKKYESVKEKYDNYRVDDSVLSKIKITEAIYEIPTAEETSAED